MHPLVCALWVSVDLFMQPGTGNAGVFVTVGINADVIGQRAPPVAPIPVLLSITPTIARRAVDAAWRVSGLGSDDASLDAMAQRMHWSALLPDARLRVLRSTNDRASTTSSGTSTDEDRVYVATGDTTWIEGRLEWRLDRLAFGDEEIQIERIRIDRLELRARIAARVTEQLVRWQRARVDADSHAADTQEHVDGELRAFEAEITLDVLTGGWFSRWLASL